MKRNILKLFVWAGLFTMTGCVDDLTIENNGTEVITPEGLISINVGMPNEFSRVAYDDAALKLTWQEGDILKLVGYDADGNYVDQVYFNLTNGIGETSACFEGKPIEGAADYIIYYQTPKLIVSYGNGKAHFTYDGQTQESNTTTDHLKDYLYLKSDKISATSLANGNFSLKMLNSIVRFNLNSLPDNLNDLISMVWLNNGGTDKVYSYSLGFNHLAAGDIQAYISFDPSTMTLPKNGTLEVQLYSPDKIYSQTVTSANGKTYKAGARSTGTLNSWTLTDMPTEQILVMSPNNKDMTKDGFSCSDGQTNYGYYSLTKDDQTPITAIPGNFFNFNQGITHVLLPATVTAVGDGAFSSCSNLEYITVPERLTTIGARAFNSCSKLRSFTFPATLETMGQNAFYTCSSLTHADLSATKVTKLEQQTFASCKELVAVKLPAGLTAISSKAFNGCVKLSEIDIPASVTSLGNTVFYYCNSLKKVIVRSSTLKLTTDEFDMTFGNTPENAELWLNQALKGQVKSGNLWAGKKWSKITYIDENGQVVTP